MNLQLVRCFGVALLVSTILLGGCDKEPYPPVEIMGATMGIIVEDPDKPTRRIRTNIVPLKPGQKYTWVIYLRTNKEKVRFSERIELAGPTTWGVRSDVKYEISQDKRSVTVEREKTKDVGVIYGTWGVSEGDPPGKATLTIRIEDKVEHKFDFELKK